MFRKTDTNEQLDIFSSPSTYMKGRTAKKYEDPHTWHNEFYQYVTSKIDEETFRPLFKEGNMGAPNASIRILVAMSILKEGFGCSDEDLFELSKFTVTADGEFVQVPLAQITWYHHISMFPKEGKRD